MNDMQNTCFELPVNDQQLSISFTSPKSTGQPFPLIIFTHGFAGNKIGEHRLFIKASRFFASQGFATLRFDFSGCGESSGDYGEVTLSKQLIELKEIIQYAQTLEEIDQNRIILLGHSLGGAISALVAADFPFIQEVILWSAVSDPYEELLSITGKDAQEIAYLNGEYDFNGFILSKQFFQDLKHHNPLKKMEKFKGKLIALHGDRDQDISSLNLEKYKLAFLANNEPERFCGSWIPFADHTFTNTNWEQLLIQKTHEYLLKTS
ncbi:putative hydrolase [Bacillus sp. TS-2]|nr:putative hydrolase [Bacillus sp. TS-2]